MFRKIIGFVIFAVLAVLGVKILFGLFGTLLKLALSILWLAFLGWIFYLVLRVVSPEWAGKLRSMVTGKTEA